MAKFSAASAPELPNLVCVGDVADVAPTKESESGNYNVTAISLIPRGGGRQAKYHLLTHPIWLTPGFNPKEAGMEDGQLFVYRKNIASSDGPGALPTLTGSEDRAEKLVDEIFSAATTVEDTAGNKVAVCPNEALDVALQKYVAGTVVGYILKQETEKVGDAYLKLSRYKVDSFFFPTPEALKRYRGLAEKNPDRWKAAFDNAF